MRPVSPCSWVGARGVPAVVEAGTVPVALTRGLIAARSLRPWVAPAPQLPDDVAPRVPAESDEPRAEDAG
jgi:hypothetical protein